MLALLFAALAVSEGTFVARDFRFASGETLPELRIHYRTIGTLRGDNAVLVLHGTTGSGTQFLGETFAGALFGPGQLLDTTKYFIILPDGIGHGGSSKPSDGLHSRFPQYGYADMVEAQRRLVVEKLGVQRLRLLIGTSMGCMHGWNWVETHPQFVDAALLLACLPAQIAGRNRMLRRMAVESIRRDHSMRGALEVLFFMSSAPLRMQSLAPTREQADKLADEWMAKQLAMKDDPDDFVYAFEASRDYDPSAGLDKIEAAVTAVNSADDEVNPPELGILEPAVRRVKRGRAVVLPIGPQTRGHGTHTNAEAWKDELSALLERSR